MENNNNSSKGALIVLGLVIVIAIVSLVLRLKVVPKPTKFTSENVQVQSTDLSNQTGINRLPAGFPQNTPVELANITASETISYPDRKVVLNNVSYFSSKQQEELFSIYGAFLKKDGYTITKTEKSASRMTYVATKNKSEITVTITPQTSNMIVLVSILTRQ